MHFATIITAATLAATAIAVPVTLNKRNYCTAVQDDWAFLTYTVQIGEPFINGAGCGAVWTALIDAMPSGVGNFACVDDGQGRSLCSNREVKHWLIASFASVGYTKLTFDAQVGLGEKVDKALSSIYTMVHAFNCPSEGSPPSPSKLIKRRIIPNTQSCATNDYEFNLDYKIIIGVPFNKGVGCGDVHNAIMSCSSKTTLWDCADDGWGRSYTLGRLLCDADFFVHRCRRHGAELPSQVQSGRLFQQSSAWDVPNGQRVQLPKQVKSVPSISQRVLGQETHSVPMRARSDDDARATAKLSNGIRE